MVMHLPGVSRIHSDQDTRALAQLKIPANRHSNYLVYNLKGTTFSGEPTTTTLGNTFRSILYTHFYLKDIQHDCYRLMVSGDDVCIFVKRQYANDAVRAIRFYSC